MLTMFILGLSIVLQIIASVLALRLIPLTRGWKAWVLIAAALLLIVVRRVIRLGVILTGLDNVGPSDFIENIVDLALSALLVAGVWFIGPLFVRMAHEREAFRQGEEKHKGLIETTDTGYVIVDDQGRVIDANQEYVRLTGRNRLEEVLGHNVLEWTASHDLERNEREVRKCIEKGFVRDLELDYVTPGGQLIPIEINATVLLAAGVAQILTLCRDITDRREAQDALRKAKDELEQRVEERTAELSQSRARLDALFRSSPIGIFLTRLEDGRILEMNDAALQIIGCTADEVASRTSLELNVFVNPDDRKRVVEALQRDGKVEGFELKYRQKSGRIVTVLLNALPLGVDGVPCILGTQLDITDRKQAEEALRKSEQAARDFSQRLVVLHKVATKLSGSSSLHDLCRQAVELGRSRLQFDRLGLWLIGDDLEYAVGTYGTDEAGNLRDERNERACLTLGDIFGEAVHGGKPVVLRAGEALTNGQGQVVGKGHHATASLWDGKKIIGCLSVDNLLHGQPISESDCRVLMLYAASVGQLCSRMRRDNELQQAVARLKDLEAIITRSGAVAFLWDASEHWPVKYVSGNVSQFGYTVDELLSRQYSWSDIVVREDQPRLTQEVLAAFASGTHELVQQYRIRTKSGDIRWVEDHTRLIGPDGGISQAEGVLLDITDRKRAVDALRESEERYRTIIETAMDGFWLADTQGHLLEVNGAYCRMSGYSRQELLTMRIADLEANKTAEELVAHIQKVVAQGQDRFESQHRRKDGSVFDVDVSILYRPDNGGQGVIFLRDITDRKRAEAEMARLAQQRQTALDAARLGSWHYDPITRVMSGDARYREIFALTDSQNLNDETLARLHPKDLARIGAATEAALAPVDPKPYSIEYRIRHPDGTVRWVEAHGATAFEGEGTARRATGITGTVADITGRKTAEEELRSAHASLQANAAQLRVLAHELTRVEQRERRRMAALLHDHLQQLLVAAKLNIASLTKGPLEADQQESARKAIAAPDEGVSQSRSLAVELSPPVLREGGLGHALQWLGKRMHDLQGLTVHVEAGDGDGRIDEDLRIVLFNAVRELLFNVVKHANVRSARVEMRILPDNQVQIAVDDEGDGFVPAEAESKTKERGGLGLFAIRERLESLGGQFDIDSSPGRGSRITLTAPIHSSGPAKEQNHRRPLTQRIPQGSSADQGSERLIRVLLVDDHAMIRQGIGQLLSQAPDIEVVGEASDGEEAVRLALNIRPDVVVMDVNMPKMNGIEATRAIRATAPGIAVIGLSMYDEAHRADEMRQAGATAYIAKSEVAEALVAAIYACRTPQAR